MPDEVLARFKNQAGEETIADCLEIIHVRSEEYLDDLNLHHIIVPKGEVLRTIEKLYSCDDILFAEPNYYVQSADTFPNDPEWARQYGLLSIRAPQGWDISTGSNTITIAIIDSGVDLTHTDIVGKIVPGYDFVNNDTIPQDDFGHGTHVAGIAAASSNNGIGIAGVSWGARIMPVKVLNSTGGGTYLDVARGITWAVDHGAQVINLSLGGGMPSKVLEDAVNYAYAGGLVQVAAAGNTGSGIVLYPARYNHVIAVAATDSSNTRASFSNFGPEIDLAAPGASIYSLYLSDGYGYRSGTSMAAPFVSGLAAILLGIPGSPGAAYLEEQMKATALDLGTSGWDMYYGAGLIQMDAAINLALPPTPTPTPTATATATPNPTPTASATATWTPTPITTTDPALLPTTGFAPRHRTKLDPQPAKDKYTDTNLTLDIPSLNVNTPITGVPQIGGSWDVSWLGNNTGWLDGSAFPTWAGNTVLTGHVWNADGAPGIFSNLKTLKYGDQVIVRAFGQTYNYTVIENKLVSPRNTSTVFQHEEYDWVTLLTCELYNPLSKTYLFRRMVRAVLVSIK